MVEEYISSIFEYLNKNVVYALLRNHEGLPNNNASRDIDIIIEKREFKGARKGIEKVLLGGGWRLFSFLDNGRLITYVCARMDGCLGVEMVQWDFFVDTSLHGVILAEAREMLPSREFNGVLYHVSQEWEFLDKYLYNRAVGAAYPAKYQRVRSLVEQSDVVRGKLKLTFGCGCGCVEQCEQLSGQTLLWRAFVRNLWRNPLSTIFSAVSSWILYLWQFVISSVAPRFSFTGADGVGKSTIIELIRSQTAPLYGQATEYLHFRPMLLPNIGEVAYRAGVKESVDREYSSPHRARRKGFLSSLLRLCYYSLDYLLGYWVKVKPHCKITKIVIFDRYFSDVIVDSRRSSIDLNFKFLYLWSRLFIPRMHYNFLITADPEIILFRKQELDLEAITMITYRMNYLANKRGYYLINNNETAQEAVDEIMEIIIDEQHKRNIKRL